MMENISEPISVELISEATTRKVYPYRLRWRDRDYKVTKVGLHHTFREGKTLYHIFSVESPSLFFRLSFNTDSLLWKVEEVSDGEPY